jgi:2-polyprenyl-3-methyl-5-hydroxy-6-metoxy-1,4-benzoquinol methylase
MEITNKQFWNAFWEGIKLPQRVDLNFQNDAIIAKYIKAYVPKGNEKKTMLEIGCAPGKWLVFFYEALSYCVKGYEYVEIAANKTIENLIMNQVPRTCFNVTIADFQKLEDPQMYNVVLSLGFVEHFNDFVHILEKQLAMVKENGYLIVGVPNFLGINAIIQRLIDPYLKDKILPTHNSKAMVKKIHSRFARDHNLQVLFNDYIGGFEPSLFEFNAVPNVVLRKALKAVTVLLASRFVRKLNNNLISGYLLSIFRKRQYLGQDLPKPAHHDLNRKG